jgi:hypothetical protein
MHRRLAIEFVIGAFMIGCGGATFVPGDGDGGPDASSTGTGTTTGSSGTSGSSTTATSGSTGSTGSGTSGSGTSGSTTSSVVTSGSTGSMTGTSGSGGSGGSAGGAGGAGGTGGGGAGSGGGSGGDAGIDWSQCTGPGQCTPLVNGCCSPCGTPTVDNFAGVNPKYTDAFKMAVCPVPMPCPRCATGINPYIGARCGGAHCQAFDSRLVPEFSKCGADTECRLRNGLECCECNSQGSWTAVSIAGQAALNAAVCAPNTGCPDCAPVPPAGAKAVCIQGHCEIAMTP